MFLIIIITYYDSQRINLRRRRKITQTLEVKQTKNATHMEYTSDFYYYTSYYIVWPPPLLLGRFELKKGKKDIGNVLGSVRMLNYQQFFRIFSPKESILIYLKRIPKI